MKVTIYTIPDCPYSKEEKEYLTAKGVQYDEKDVSNDKDNLSEMLDLSQKFAGVPFSVVYKDSGEKVMLKGFTKADFDIVLGDDNKAQEQSATVPAETDMSMPTVTDTGMSSGADVAMPPVPGMPGMPSVPSVPAMPSVPAIPDMSMPPSPQVPDMSMPSAQMPDFPNLSNPVSSAPVASSQAPVGMPTMPQDPMGMSFTAPVAPVMPTAPVMPAPVMPTAPVMPQASTPAEPADPQDELSGLLKDLEAKVSSQAAAPAAPADVQTPPTAPQA